MSCRTKDADKAVRLAWEREQKLVREGKGTRDWTAEQQREILDPDKGRAHDENNRTIEGQHMRSVEKNPEYQGNPDNIQFLTREEHFEAHKRNWQNPTNWYYDPISKEYVDFGDGEIIPCKVIELSDPIYLQSKTTPAEEIIDNSTSNNAAEKVTTKKPHTENNGDNKPEVNKTIKSGRIKEHIDKVADTVKCFARKQLTPEYVKELLVSIAVPVVTAIVGVVLAVYNSNSSGGSGESASNDNDDDDYDNDCDDYTESESVCVERDYPEERTSPREHNVSGYDRQQNGKTVHVNPYTRGGHKDEE